MKQKKPATTKATFTIEPSNNMFSPQNQSKRKIYFLGGFQKFEEKRKVFFFLLIIKNGVGILRGKRKRSNMDSDLGKGET